MTCCEKMELLEEIGSVTIYRDGVVNQVDSKFGNEWPTEASNKLRFILCPYCGKRLNNGA